MGTPFRNRVLIEGQVPIQSDFWEQLEGTRKQDSLVLHLLIFSGNSFFPGWHCPMRTGNVPRRINVIKCRRNLIHTWKLSFINHVSAHRAAGNGISFDPSQASCNPVFVPPSLLSFSLVTPVIRQKPLLYLAPLPSFKSYFQVSKYCFSISLQN